MSLSPTIITEIAFASQPGAPSVWTNVSNRLMGLKIARGRNLILDRMETGIADIMLNNKDRALDPLNSNGPWYPNVKPMRRIRIRATIPPDPTIYPLYSGFISSPQGSKTGWNGRVAHIRAMDLLGVLAQTDLPSSAWAYEMKRLAPDHWYRLGEADAVTASRAYDSGSAAAHGTHEIGHATADSIVPYDGDGATFYSQANGYFTQLPQAAWLPATGGTYTIAFVARLDALGRLSVTSQWRDGRAMTIYAAPEIGVPFQQFSFQDYVPLDSANSRYLNAFTNTDQGNVADGRGHLFVIVVTPASVTWYVDGVQTNTGGPMGSGYWEDPGPSQSPNRYPQIGRNPNGVFAGEAGYLDEFAIFRRALTSAEVARLATTLNTVERSGTRVARIFDMAGVPDADRLIDAGSSLLQVTPTGEKALADLQAVVDSEFGALYADTQGRGRFRARHTLLRPPYTVSQATFGVVAGTRRYETSSYDFSEQRIVNEAVIARVHGSAQIVRDQASIDEYLLRRFSRDGLLYTSDEESIDAGAWVVQRNREPRYRVTELRIRPFDTATLVQCLTRELEDRITFQDGVISPQVHIQGITHELTGNSWSTTWRLDDADTNVYAVLDDTTYGRLNSARLAF